MKPTVEYSAGQPEEGDAKVMFELAAEDPFQNRP